jgi:tetratricopeptide (TPR) repeat protein
MLVAALAVACLIPAPAQTTADEAAGQAMQQGAEAMSAGNFAQAAADYKKVTQLLPNRPEGYFNLGLALQQAEQLDEARAAIERALHLKPGLRGANLFLGIIAYRQNHFKEAEADLLRETRLDPRNAKAFMWLGVCRLAEDDPQAAIPPLDKAYALAPTDADILYHRGHAYFLVANASYAAMFKLNRDSMRVHQVLAEAYAQAYRNQEAIDEFKLAIRMAPKQPGLHEELGDQYWIIGQLDKVATAYREELEVDPYAVSAMYKLGCLLILEQNPAEGVRYLRAALHADPSLSDAHYYLGNGLMNLDQNQDAIHEYQLAIAADPSNNRAMSSYYKLAEIYRKLHEAPQAQEAMKNFLRMRAAIKERRELHTAQIARTRAELPVEDPEKVAMLADK